MAIKKKEKIVGKKISKVPVKHAHKVVKQLLTRGIPVHNDRKTKKKSNSKNLGEITRSKIENVNKTKQKILEEYMLTPEKKSKSKINKANNMKSKINKTKNVKNIEAQETSSSNIQQKKIEEIDAQQETHDPKTEKTTNSESSNSGLSRKRKRTDSESQEGLRRPFDPKILPKESTRQCISGILTLIQEQLKDKNDLLPQEAKPIFMQVTCVKIPVYPPGQMKLLLPHSMISPDDEIVLFVPDLEKKKRKDYETTIEHYRKLLEANKCTQITKIIPLYQLHTEYNQFELKRKLAASYDHFLVDGRISGPIWHFVGKAFHQKRKTPVPFRMATKNLKREIDNALRKTGMRIHSHGDTHCVQVGTTLMKKKEIFQNILAACNHLRDYYPGRWENIRALLLKGETTMAVPIYQTLKNKNTVDRPIVKPKRPKAYRDVEGELSTKNDKIVIVKPTGEVRYRKNYTVEKKEKKNSINQDAKRTKKM